MTREQAIAILREEREGICTDMQCAMTMYRDYSGVDKCNQDCEEREAYDMAIEALQAEPKHGTWTIDEKHTEEIYTNPVYCSVCGKDVVMDYGEYAPYCPNCGAKMDGGKDEK